MAWLTKVGLGLGELISDKIFNNSVRIYLRELMTSLSLHTLTYSLHDISVPLGQLSSVGGSAFSITFSQNGSLTTKVISGGWKVYQWVQQHL